MTSDLFGDLPMQAVPEREGGGRPRLRMAERVQVELRAVSLDDLVPAAHWVRAVWRFVEGLDLSPILAELKAVEGRPGHPPADPRILMALWLNATIEGIGSARALVRRCAEDIPFQWLCGGVGMNHKTLSDFRIGHGAILEGVLADSFAALMAAGVAGLERVAQDGVRVRASAGAAFGLHLCADLVGDSLRSLRDRCLRTADRWLARVHIHDDQVRPRRAGSSDLAKKNAG